MKYFFDYQSLECFLILYLSLHFWTTKVTLFIYHFSICSRKCFKIVRDFYLNSLSHCVLCFWVIKSWRFLISFISTSTWIKSLSAFWFVLSLWVVQILNFYFPLNVHKLLFPNKNSLFLKIKKFLFIFPYLLLLIVQGLKVFEIHWQSVTHLSTKVTLIKWRSCSF